jgi:glucoamylase
LQRASSGLGAKAILPFLFLLLASTVFAQTVAPGGPGKDAQWATAGKQAIGTSATRESKVWFTLAQGVMTEVYYPDVTVANVHMLQFVVVNPKTKKVETERDDAFHQIKPLKIDSLSFQQINTAKSGKWTITKTYSTGSYPDTLLIDVVFSSKNPDLKLYVQYDPSLGNTGMGDEGRLGRMSDCIACQFPGHHLLSSVDEKANISSHLFFSSPISEIDSGFAGSDGIEQLKRSGRIAEPSVRSGKGNIVQTARIDRPAHFMAVLALGTLTTSPIGSIDGLSFEGSLQEYEKGWADYVKTLPKVEPKYQAQFNMAAMVLKAQEDKTVPGANVASLTVPWGGGANANEDVGGGYHLVWSRDLYHVFTAYLAIGDRSAAERALDFLFKIQQKEDGSFPQNSWLDGKHGWGSLQMDEVGYPLIMAWQLERFDKQTYEKHVKRAADFIIKNGPFTPQERWEERPGYSPSTIAAEIAGLVCAADIAKRNGDDASSLIWLAAADDWARNVERWTATTKGKYGDGNYYIRISEKGEPDDGHKIELNNNAGTFPETDIVDAGFLELVRLGIKPADDPLIVKSLSVIDQVIKVETPNGPAFYRYNNDGYGEMPDGRRWNWDGKYTGKGRLWALLSGERAQYEIASCTQAETRAVASVPRSQESCLSQPKTRLDHMLAFANEGLMISEQIWDKKEIPANVDRQFIPELKFGEGTGSATPLAWSMAQFIRLLTNINAGKNLDTPQIVYDRYKNGIPAKTSNFGGMDEEVVLPTKPGEVMSIDRQVQVGTKVAYSLSKESAVATAGADGKAKLLFTTPAEPAIGLLGIQGPDGSTAFERVKVRVTPVQQTLTPEELEKIRKATKSPIIDGDNAIFFYRGNANVVGIAGDMTGWDNGRIFMQKIGDGLFAYRSKFGSNSRSEYKMVVDGKWILDPSNLNKINNGVGGENSVFEMPGYRASEMTRDVPGLDWRPDAIEIDSKVFGEKRNITVYAVMLSATEPNPQRVIYIHDGGDYVKRARAIEVWSNLVAEKRVRPFIMVFLDPKDRMKEYWANDKWADFVANEVVPEIDRRYSTVKDRDGRAVIGASLGGITSLNIALRHPDKFSRIGAQSASFWVDNERVVKGLEKLDSTKRKFKFYIDDGVFEGVDDSRRVNVMLRAKGYPVTYIEGQTGHNWTAWRDRLADAFVALMN